MVTVSEKHRDNFKALAKEIVDVTGETLELREYEVSTVLEVFKP